MPEMSGSVLFSIGVFWKRLIGWRFEGELANEDKLVIAIAPHTSNWDFFVGVPLMLSIRARVSVMMKQEAFFWPFKTILQHIGFVPVNRKEAGGIVGSAVRQFSQRDKLWLAITPEGTRARGRNWKMGFLHIAKGADVPVQLLAFDYKNKRFVFGPVFRTGEDLEADLDYCKTYFLKFQGRH